MPHLESCVADDKVQALVRRLLFHWYRSIFQISGARIIQIIQNTDIPKPVIAHAIGFSLFQKLMAENIADEISNIIIANISNRLGINRCPATVYMRTTQTI